MRVLGLISSKNDPSPRVRILQYADYLLQQNVTLYPLEFYPHMYADPPAWANKIHRYTKISPWRFLDIQKKISRIPLISKSHGYDLIWQNRLILPHSSLFERILKKPRIFDFDDAIWVEDNEKEVGRGIKGATAVFAGNEYLAEFAVKHNKNVYIVPSVIDTTRLYPKKSDNQNFTIGWIGTITNFPFLELAKPAIVKFLSENKTHQFIIVSSEPPGNFDYSNKQIIFKQWSIEKENEYINSFSIGIMPLEETTFTKGKCSYKMLQYMACGKPVVVSPIGMNKTILEQSEVGIGARNHDEWYKAFRTLLKETSLYESCSKNAQNTVVQNYSLKRYAPEVLLALKKAANIQ